MAATRISGQTFQPMTCFCVIAQGVYRDGTDWKTATVVQESIVRKCVRHTAYTDATALMTAIRVENQAYSRAIYAIKQYPPARARMWYVEEGTNEVQMDVLDASNSLKTDLAAISNLSVTYSTSA